MWNGENSTDGEAYEGEVHIAPTIDIWTDRRVHSFLGVTAHTFRSCKSFTGLLAFKVLKGQHAGVRIVEELVWVLEENGIKEKVFLVVCDNASNMRKAFDVIRTLVASEDGADTVIELMLKYYIVTRALA